MFSRHGFNLDVFGFCSNLFSFLLKRTTFVNVSSPDLGTALKKREIAEENTHAYIRAHTATALTVMAQKKREIAEENIHTHTRAHTTRTFLPPYLPVETLETLGIIGTLGTFGTFVCTMYGYVAGEERLKKLIG